jgi:putative phosphoribosyl transferase
MAKRVFKDRYEAGRVLAGHLLAYANRPNVIVLALPRGGVPVGFEVALALNVALDVFVVRKLGLPGHPELAMGAVASGGVRVLNPDIVEPFQVPPAIIEQATQRELAELERRERLYRDDLPAPEVKGKVAILVDDGLATGATMRAAAQALKKLQAARTVVAVPTASAETCAEFKAEVDEIICAITPEPFYSVGSWYWDFSQTGDDEVQDLLRQARLHQPGPAATFRENWL